MTRANTPEHSRAALREYERLFNREAYFEAHEVLEAAWRLESGKNRDYLQGLIQIAAALVHFRKDNLTGAHRLLDSATQYLDASPRGRFGIRHKRLLEETRKCFSGENPLPKVEISPILKEKDGPV